MWRVLDVAVADDDLGRPVDDRLHDLDDVGPDVLVVGVGIDDDVRAEAQRRVDAGDERRSEAAVAHEANDVIGAGLACRGDGAVRRAVVDHQRLDPAEAVDPFREIGNRTGDGRFFVVCGNLDDEFQRLLVGFRLGRRILSARPEAVD